MPRRRLDLSEFEDESGESSHTPPRPRPFDTRRWKARRTSGTQAFPAADSTPSLHSLGAPPPLDTARAEQKAKAYSEPRETAPRDYGDGPHGATVAPSHTPGLPDSHPKTLHPVDPPAPRSYESPQFASLPVGLSRANLAWIEDLIYRLKQRGDRQASRSKIIRTLIERYGRQLERALLGRHAHVPISPSDHAI